MASKNFIGRLLTQVGISAQEHTSHEFSLIYDAKAILENLHENMPNSTPVIYAVCTYYKGQLEFEKAIDLLEQHLSSDPEMTMPIYYLLAYCYLANEEWDNARGIIEAMENETEDPNYLFMAAAYREFLNTNEGKKSNTSTSPKLNNPGPFFI